MGFVPGEYRDFQRGSELVNSFGIPWRDRAVAVIALNAQRRKMLCGGSVAEKFRRFYLLLRSQKIRPMGISTL